MRNVLLSLCLVLSACASQTPTWFLDADGDMVGTKFVLEGRLVSAQHVAGEGFTPIGVDTVDLGPATERGYERRKTPLVVGDRVRLVLAEWPGVPREVPGVVVGTPSEGYQAVFFSSPGFPGVSGSPILDEDGRCVGTFTALNPREPRYTRIALLD